MSEPVRLFDCGEDGWVLSTREIPGDEYLALPRAEFEAMRDEAERDQAVEGVLIAAHLDDASKSPAQVVREVLARLAAAEARAEGAEAALREIAHGGLSANGPELSLVAARRLARAALTAAPTPPAPKCPACAAAETRAEAAVAAGREAARLAAEHVDSSWRGEQDPTSWHPMRLPLIRAAVDVAEAHLRATPAPDAPRARAQGGRIVSEPVKLCRHKDSGKYAAWYPMEPAGNPEDFNYVLALPADEFRSLLARAEGAVALLRDARFALWALANMSAAALVGRIDAFLSPSPTPPAPDGGKP